MPHPVSFLDHFSALRDPRQAAKVLYPLDEILLLVLAGTLAGADDFVEIAFWGNTQLAFLRRFLPSKRGIPSHDTLTEVIAAIDPDAFRACFIAWVETLRRSEPTLSPAQGEPVAREVVAIDGKTSRRSHDRRLGRAPLHLLSAWASQQRLVLGQEATAAKSNEIIAIPRLLNRLALTGAVVTIDAEGTTAKIAQTILDRGADYLLALKRNRRATYDDVVLFFADPLNPRMSHDTVDGDHGRIETRRHCVAYDPHWLTPTGHESDSVRFAGLRMIGMIESTVERAGKTSTERRYYISSARLTPTDFARAVRDHWGIENRLHWTLDVVFHDDLARLRTGFGPENMALVRHTALNLLQNANPKASLKVRRKQAAWDINFLEKLLRTQTS